LKFTERNHNPVFFNAADDRFRLVATAIKQAQQIAGLHAQGSGNMPGRLYFQRESLTLSQRLRSKKSRAQHVGC
jgi:hypothetical protein